MAVLSSPPSSVVSAGTWTNGANVYTSNDVYATNPGTTQNTEYPLDVGGFNFAAITAGSTIDSVTVTIEAKTGTAARAQIKGELYDGTTLLTGSLALTNLTAADANYTFTPTATLAQLQSANLKVRVTNKRIVSQASTTSVDYVKIDVTYTPAAPKTGAATGSYLWAGSGTGLKGTKGAATGVYTWAGSGVGLGVMGSATGAYAFNQGDVTGIKGFPKIATLIDDFDSSTLVAKGWTVDLLGAGTTLTQTGGRAESAHPSIPASGNLDNRLYRMGTGSTYDFQNSSFYAQVGSLNLPASGRITVELRSTQVSYMRMLSVIFDSSFGFRIVWRDESSTGTTVSGAFPGYDRSLPVWARFRESAGIFYVDATQTGTWVNRWSSAHAWSEFSIRYMECYFRSGTAIAGTPAQTFWLDNININGPSAAPSTPVGTGSGAYAWAKGTVTGARTPKATGSGAYAWTGSATIGKRTPKSTGSGVYIWAGTGSGKRTPKSSGVGAYAWAGGGTGKRSPKATAAGTYAWSGSATGTAPVVGPKTGTATGSHTWGGTGTGQKTPNAAASGGYSYAGNAAGQSPHRGVAAGSYAYTGTATGRKQPKATSLGSYTLAGTASGAAPGVSGADGFASGAYTWTKSTITGKRYPKASSVGAYAWTGTSVGVTTRTGRAVGAYLYVGTATGTSTGEALRDIEFTPRQPRFTWEAYVTIHDWDDGQPTLLWVGDVHTGWAVRPPRFTWTGHTLLSPWAVSRPRLTPTEQARFNKEDTYAHIH